MSQSLVAPLRDSESNQKQYFIYNLISIAFCGLAVSISGFYWLRSEPPLVTEISIELFTCLIFLLDIYQNRARHSDYLSSNIGRLSTTIAVIPWYTISMLFPLTSSSHPLYVLIAHLSFAPYLMLRFRTAAREHMVPRQVKLALAALTILFTLHWLTVIWMVLRPRSDVDPLTEYNLAMYFLVTTLSTVGYGDITPGDNISRIFTMFLQLSGVGIFGVVIGQVSQIIVSADRRKEQTRSQLEALASLNRHYNVPADLQRKTYKFFRHVLSRSSNEEEQQILAKLPHALQSEIRVYMNAKPLSRVSMFRNCQQSSLVDAAKEMEQVFFAPEQKILTKGETGDVMYLIGHGRVKVHDGDHFIAELGDGQCFGEMALVDSEPRKADVTALTHCDAFSLSKARFDYLMQTHADLRANVETLVESRSTQSK